MHMKVEPCRVVWHMLEQLALVVGRREVEHMLGLLAYMEAGRMA